MRSPWLPKLSWLAGQTLMELLPVWMLCTLVRATYREAVLIDFGTGFSLQLLAALAGWTSRRFLWPALLRAALLLATGSCLVIGIMGLRAPTASSAFAWIIAIYLVTRGLFCGLSAGEPGAALRWFGWGAGACVLFAAFLALSGTPDAALPSGTLRGLCLAYFTLGALLAGLDQRRSVLAGTEQSSTLSAPALFAVLAPVLAFASVAVLPVIATEGTGSLVRASGAGFVMLVHGVNELLRYAGRAIETVLRWLGSFWGNNAAEAGPPAAIGCGEGHWSPLVQARPSETQLVSGEALSVLISVTLALALAYVVLGLARRRAGPPASSEARHIQEESGSSWSWRLLLEPLNRLRTHAHTTTTAPPPAAGTQDLRALYRALIAWAAAHGQRRRVCTTAGEFSAQLSREYPSRQRELQQLEHYYALERYAERSPQGAELEHARALLGSITRDQQAK